MLRGLRFIFRVSGFRVQGLGFRGSRFTGFRVSRGVNTYSNPQRTTPQHSGLRVEALAFRDGG